MRATEEELKKFHSDRDKLPYNDAGIAERMGLERSNFSSYITGNLPITRFFLRRFYQAFAIELSQVMALGSKIDQLKKDAEAIQKGCGKLVKAMEQTKQFVTAENANVERIAKGNVDMTIANLVMMDSNLIWLGHKINELAFEYKAACGVLELSDI